MKDFEVVIPEIGEDTDVFFKGFSIKAILNVIIEFVNKLIKFEF